MSVLVPTVIERTEKGERAFDISECTGQTTERITTDIDRDYILRDEAALAYGVVDQLVEPSRARRLPLPPPQTVLAVAVTGQAS